MKAVTNCELIRDGHRTAAELSVALAAVHRSGRCKRLRLCRLGKPDRSGNLG